MIEVRYRDRLGNNLFQYALGRILAEEKGYALQARPIHGFPNTRKPVPGAVHDEPQQILQMQHIDFAGLLADKNPRRIILHGWFQRGEYYWPYRDRIREWFAPDPSIHAPLLKPDLVVHVRRTDYILHGWALPFSYYEEAIERLIPPGGTVCILTDDPTDPFFRQFERWKPHFCEGDALQQFWLMCRPPRLVISQSTFSWWPAFLAESQTTICPAPTFGCWRTGSDNSGIELVDRDRFLCIDCTEPYTRTESDSWRALRLRRLKRKLSLTWNRAFHPGKVVPPP
jgi:hypothetical protein